MVYRNPPRWLSVPETLYMSVCMVPCGPRSPASLTTLTLTPGPAAPSTIFRNRVSTSPGLAALAHTAHASVLPRMERAKLPTAEGTTQAAPFPPAPTNALRAIGLLTAEQQLRHGRSQV